MDVPLPGGAVSGAIVIGKLPFHGDFIARGISGSEQREIDRWLTQSVEIARNQFRASFDETFDAAPPWRFAWQDGRWIAGALVPSADAAGRRFPLLVALSGLAGGQVASGARLCEEAASDAIALRWSADQLVETIDAAEIEADGTNAAEGWWNEELAGARRLHEPVPPIILSHMLASAAGATA